MRDLLKYVVTWFFFVVLSILALIFCGNSRGEMTVPQRERVVAFLVAKGELLEYNGRQAIVIPMKGEVDVDGEKMVCPVFCGLYQESKSTAYLQVHMEVPVGNDENGNKQVVTHFVRDTNGDGLPEICQMSIVVYTSGGVILKNAGWSKISETDVGKESMKLWNMVMGFLLVEADKHFGVISA